MQPNFAWQETVRCALHGVTCASEPPNIAIRNRQIRSERESCFAEPASILSECFSVRFALGKTVEQSGLLIERHLRESRSASLRPCARWPMAWQTEPTANSLRLAAKLSEETWDGERAIAFRWSAGRPAILVPNLRNQKLGIRTTQAILEC